jgi:hypothetical protein
MQFNSQSVLLVKARCKGSGGILSAFCVLHPHDKARPGFGKLLRRDVGFTYSNKLVFYTREPGSKLSVK